MMTSTPQVIENRTVVMSLKLHKKGTNRLISWDIILSKSLFCPQIKRNVIKIEQIPVLNKYTGVPGKISLSLLLLLITMKEWRRLQPLFFHFATTM